jgi:Tfp pilus assembly protein PilV
MSPQYLAGFSLLEVLISLLLLSFVLFGFDATEVYSLRTIRAAYYFDMANNQLNNMVERLYLINNDSDSLQQVAIWNMQNKTVLPEGLGQVTGHFPVYKITVYWGKKISPCQQNQLGTSGCLTETITI